MKSLSILAALLVSLSASAGIIGTGGDENYNQGIIGTGGEQSTDGIIGTGGDDSGS